MKEKNMKFSNIKLPTNKKFGYLFSGIFLIASTYFLYIESQTIGYLFAILASLFLLTTLINADLLLPFNKLWMRFGILLGMIISPIVLGIIFFGLITPYGLVMRIMGRDELRIKLINNRNHWILRSKTSPQTDFKQQF